MNSKLPKNMLCDNETTNPKSDATGVEIIIENLTTNSIHTLLYQSEIDITAGNYLTGSWKQDMIAPGGTGRTFMPVEISVAGSDKFGELSTITKEIKSGNGKKFELFDNGGALDIRDAGVFSSDGTINVKNCCAKRETIYIFKEGCPLLCAELRPNQTESILLKPKIGIAIAENELREKFFDAASLSQKMEFDLTNQSFLKVSISEDQGSGLFIFNYSYTR